MKKKRILSEKPEIDRELQEIIKSNPIPIYGLNHNLKYICVNYAAASLIQKDLKELLGKKITYIFPNIEQTRFGRAYREVLRTKTPRKITDDFKNPDTNHMAFYEVQILPYKSGIICIATNISKFKRELKQKAHSKRDLKQTKTKLNRVKRGYNLLMDNVNDFIAIVDSNFKFEDVNKIHNNQLGYELNDIIGKKVLNFIHPEDRPQILPLIKQAFKWGSSKAVFRFKHKNGSWIWMEAKGKTFRHEDGSLKGIVISRDITDRKKRQRQQEKYIKEQKIINETIINLSRKRDIDAICNIIANAVNQFNKEAIIIVSLYNKQLEAITLRAISGPSERKEKLFEVLENNFSKFLWNENDMGSEKKLYTTGKLEYISGGLHTLAAGKIPKHICENLENSFNIGDTYSVGFALDDKPYGGISIFLPNGESIQHREAIETLASYVSVLLHRRQVQNQLKQSEERYREIFEGSRDGFVMVDTEGKIIDANQAYCEMLGYTLEELKNLDNFYSITPKKWHKWEKDEIWDKKLMKNGYSGVYEKEYIKNDGTVFPVELQSYTVFGEGQKIKYLWGVARNITERKQAELKIKESEKKYRELFNNMSSGVAVYEAINNGENFVFRDFNLAAQRIEKLKAEKVIGNKVTDLFPSIHDFGLFNVFQRVWKTGTPELHPISKYEDNRISGWRESYIYKLPTGEIVAVYDDVTEEKIAKQKLSKSEKKFRLLYETMAQGVVYQNRDGKIISANPAAEKILGISIEEMRMRSSSNPNWRSIRENGSPLPGREHASMVALRTGKEVKNKTMGIFNPKKNEYRWIKIDAVPLFRGNERRPYQVYTTFTDITERIRTEKKLTQLNKMKSELLRRTSHELKTPLISIKGFSNLILEQYSEDLNGRIINYLSEIDKGCQRLEKVIKRILYSAQLDSGIVEVSKSRENLYEVIKNATEALKGAAEVRNHSITIDIDKYMVVNVQREKILEVVENLLSNAIKYTPSNGHITIVSQKTKEDYIISIEDDGLGFTPEEKDILFTQFGKIERYGRGYDVGIDGTGLGLYVSKKIIELYGGEIWMESEGRKKGSTFYFSLPRAD